MGYARIAERLGEAFVDRPVEFGTEADLRRELVTLLEARLSDADALEATVDEQSLLGSSPSYKRDYLETIESRMRDRGTVGRIRLDLSVAKGRRYDVGVFAPTLEHPIEWVRNGSKRFDPRDLDAVFDLKFIKNKCYPPTRCSITADRLDDCSVEELRSELNTRENGLAGDFEELASLPGDVETVFVLVSNNNYLFAEPTAGSEAAETTKRRVGAAAREWIAENAGDTDVLYAHPLGTTWIA